MDWDAPHQVSRSLSLEISRAGELVATSSISRPPQVIELDALPVLMAFAGGAPPRAVLAKLQADWEIDEGGFAALFEVLVKQAFLVPVGTSDAPVQVATLASAGFASLLTHQRLVADAVRVQTYQTAIFRHCAGRSVVEIGCGSGILSIFAAQAGARRVIAIEESEIAALAEEMFEANGVADRIELEDRPYRDRSRVVAETAELPGLYGVDFTPFLRRLEEVRPQLLPPPMDLNPPFKPRILSEELRLLDLDLRDETLVADRQLGTVRLRVHQEGMLAGAVMFFRAHLDETLALSTSPHAPPTTWGYDVRTFSRRLRVTPEMEIPLRLSVENVLGRQRVSLDLE
jgi:SAM-dependent methyltransferase